MKTYFNEQGDILYTLHLPGDHYIEAFQQLQNDNKERIIHKSNNITVISIMTRDCWEKSLVREQCEFNNIEIINPGIDEKKWNNALKINYILEALEQVTTEYAIILDGKDVCICNDLDDTLLQKIDPYKVTYNGDPFQYPKIDIEGPEYKNKLKNVVNKYLNAGVCIGKISQLKRIYNLAYQKKQVFLDNNSEQFLIRKVFKQRPELFDIDYQGKIFGIVHKSVRYFEENEQNKVFLKLVNREERFKKCIEKF